MDRLNELLKNIYVEDERYEEWPLDPEVDPGVTTGEEGEDSPPGPERFQARPYRTATPPLRRASRAV